MTTTTAAARAIRGTFFHTPEYGSFEMLEQALIELDGHGAIERITLPADPAYPERLRAAREANEREPGYLFELGEHEVVLPGFVDLHVHAPQWPQAGIALDEPLEVWLNERTFPLEARFGIPEGGDPTGGDFALPIYLDLVGTLLSRGTTTCVYFGSADRHSSEVLARACAQLNQRAVVGKVVMDDPAANPAFYRDASPEQALADTEDFIAAVEQHAARSAADDPRFPGLFPAVTPRFIPSCTETALRGLGEIAQAHDAYVQSHCDESQWQSGVARERFGKSDAEALADFGLLKRKAIMAHGTFLLDGEAEIFRATGAALAHCPISNAYFGNAVCPVRRIHDQGVTIGLGTDISGGFSPSLYDDIRMAVMASRILEDGVDARVPSEQRGAGEPSRISAVEALYLATKGGGEALDLPIGSFEAGRALDMQVIDLKRPFADLTGNGVFTSPADQLERILYLTTPENIRAVWVQGRQVFARG
ncbi:amidohydrolase family protein [[Collinsella] massiliensis]|uniref:Guanine deaminase n=1 Tax=[Collinsella] massiliensis TaxID=1232426 RepID=A0A1Y3XXI2_9ACTN|nr:amidohydrolase family protein [[Collinsella] massiliensis]OUN89831.1 guanine deaminase [[Collinsella] massiliensis]